MDNALLTLFREDPRIKKNPKMQRATYDVLYETGFLAMDFLNGYTVSVNDNGHKFTYDSIGIIDGSSNMIVGRTHSGKTSLAVQIAGNIIRPFEHSQIFYDDIEGGSVDTRRMVLTGMDPYEIDRRMEYRNQNISAESFFERIYMIYEMKMNNIDKFLYNTHKVDSLGREIFKLQPTVYILDSFAVLSPENMTEDEKLSGNMSAAATAKLNTQVVKRIISKLKAANIILFTINHINEDIDINPFAKKRAIMGNMKQGEALPGGKAAQYLATNLIRVEDTVKLKDNDGMGISGRIVEISFAKSRSNESGKTIPLVFDGKTGYDPDLSLLVFMKSVNALEARGAYMCVKGTDIKFMQKRFKDKLYNDPEFSQTFSQVCYQELRKLLNDTPVDIHKPKVNSITSNIMSMVNNTRMDIS